MAPDPIWFTAQDLAHRYGKSIRTIRHWNTRRFKDMPKSHYDPSGHLRWVIKEILEWERNLQLTAAALAICQMDFPFDPANLI